MQPVEPDPQADVELPVPYECEAPMAMMGPAATSKGWETDNNKDTRTAFMMTMHLGILGKP